MGMSVGQLCKRNPVTCAFDAEIRDVVGLMREREVGSVIVVQELSGEMRPYGIITDRDLIVRVISSGENLDSLTIRDVATTDLRVVREHDSVGEAIHIMREAGIKRLPVVDALGILVGIISGDDLLLHLANEVQELAALFARSAVYAVPDPAAASAPTLSGAH